MRAVPVGNRLLVERVAEEETTASGLLVLPENSRERPMEGLVVAVGLGARKRNGERQPMDVQVGDRILFGKYSGTDIKIDNRTLLILVEEEVLVKLEVEEGS
jgi:chaperonin GroES